MATSLFAPEIYQVDPKTHTGSVVAEIAAGTGLLGIVEIEKNIFYVVAANISVTFTPTALTLGNFAVWRVDLNTFKRNNNYKALAKAEKVVDIPQAKFLNGATVLSRKEGTLLIADSQLGGIFRVNTRSKEVRLVIEDPLFAVSSAATAAAVGINGIKLDRNGDLYFTNSDLNLLGKIPIWPDGTAKAKGQVLSSSGIVSVDDFAVVRKVGFFVAQNGLDQLSFVSPAGGNATVLVRSTDQPGLKGPTSPAIGRGKGKLGRESLYVGTNGGAASYLSGNFTARGTISRLDIGEFYQTR